MAYIREIQPDEATGEVRALYDRDRETLGYVANYTKVFAHRPEVYTAWGRFIGAIRSNMDKRRYELVTLAAASQLRSSYCMLAHGAVLLRSNLVTNDQLEAIARDYRQAGLSPAESR
jgi:AhpD family alkylhydroperoxidase